MQRPFPSEGIGYLFLFAYCWITSLTHINILLSLISTLWIACRMCNLMQSSLALFDFMISSPSSILNPVSLTSVFWHSLLSVCTNQIVGKNLKIVAQWWTLCESHMLRLYLFSAVFWIVWIVYFYSVSGLHTKKNSLQKPAVFYE